MKWKNIKKTEKKILIVSSIAVLLTFIIGASYAYIAYTTRQEGINVLETDCINVTMEELTNEIRLTNAYPLTDEVGSQTKPFRFKLTNTCGVGVDYNLNLEVMETEKRIVAKNIAVKVDENAKSILSNNESAEVTINESDFIGVESYKLGEGNINPYESVTHEIRIWLDESAGNDSQNGSFYSKVVIEARQNQGVFNPDLVKLAEIMEIKPKDMNEFLKTNEDIEKIVSSKEAMELIVNSDYLKQAIKESNNYTNEVKLKFLNSTVISEVDKYNAGLPCFIFGVDGNIFEGYTTDFYYVSSSAPGASSFDSSKIVVSYKNSYYIYTSINQINIDNYNYLELDHEHSANYSNTGGSTTIGLYTNNYDDSTNFIVSKSESWLTTKDRTKITLDISNYKGNYYFKGITKHVGPESGRTITDIIYTIALY